METVDLTSQGEAGGARAEGTNISQRMATIGRYLEASKSKIGRLGLQGNESSAEEDSGDNIGNRESEVYRAIFRA